MWKFVATVVVLVLVNCSLVQCHEKKSKISEDSAAEGSKKKGLFNDLAPAQVGLR